MAETVACVAATVKLARKAAARIADRLPGLALRACSLSGYAAKPGAPRRIILCAMSRSLGANLRFLRRAGKRILWPPPQADFRDAIGGIRSGGGRPRPALRSRATASPAGDLAAALLLEGTVSPVRARAALASNAPRDWIVESARHAQISARLLTTLARAGIRWSALEPVQVVALYAAPALTRVPSRWKPLLPPGTPVWVVRRGSSAHSRLRRKPHSARSTRSSSTVSFERTCRAR